MTIDRERIFKKVAYIRGQLVDIRALTKDKTRVEIVCDRQEKIDPPARKKLIH